jgi:hypothetical protein
VQNNADASTARKLIDYLFEHQEQFSEEVLLDYTLDNFLNELATLVSSVAVPIPSRRRSTNSPSALPSTAKPPQTTPLATTGSTQSALTESRARQLSARMGRESTAHKTGASPNGLTSSSNMSDRKCIMIHPHYK